MAMLQMIITMMMLMMMMMMAMSMPMPYPQIMRLFPQFGKGFLEPSDNTDTALVMGNRCRCRKGRRGSTANTFATAHYRGRR